MKKSLNADGITNELRGASLYFARERQQKELQELPVKPVAQVAPQGVPVPVPPYGVPRPPVPPRRAIRQRQPFDVFEDQYRELKRIADEERNQGLPGSMSRMVREAIDEYLVRRKK
jgi:hypothetical protein